MSSTQSEAGLWNGLRLIGTAVATFIVVAGIITVFTGTLFAALSVSATTLAPEFPWLPEETLFVGMLIAGVLFVANRLDRLYDALMDRIGGDN